MPHPKRPSQSNTSFPPGSILGVLAERTQLDFELEFYGKVLAAVPDRGIEAGAFEEFVEAIRAGHTYANVHTNKWPGGEIRGPINDRDQREFVR